MRYIIALSIAMASQSLAAEPAMIYGSGTQSCATWVKESERKYSELAYVSWVAGFLTGLNAVAVAQGKPPISDIDVQAGVSWIDDYCAVNKLDTVARAGQALMLELVRRKILSK